MRLALLSTLAALGCGRFAFEPQELSSDALVTPPVCPIAATAPDPLMITGETFRYTSFDNMTSPLATVNVTARIGAASATFVSGAAGEYTVQPATGGVPVNVVLVASRTNFYTTTVHSDLPFDQHVTGQRVQQFVLGDLPVWDMTGMAVIYSAGAETLDATQGTINVVVRDCAGQSVAGVSVSITPAPRKQFYQSTTGAGDNMTATQLPYTHALALAAVPGMTRISASGGGHAFPEIDVPVLAGANNTLVVIHGAPLP